MFLSLLEETTRLARFLKYASDGDNTLTSKLELKNCFEYCYERTIKFEFSDGSPLKIEIWNTSSIGVGYVEKTITIAINQQMLDSLVTRIDELVLSESLQNNRIVFQSPDTLGFMITYVYMYRPSDSPCFSDEYIEREVASFGYTSVGDLYIYRFIKNLMVFHQLINTDIRVKYPTYKWPTLFINWPHLLYAYLIENTRIYEIFSKVLTEYRQGEKLGTPTSQETQKWLLSTEQLFYKDPPSYTLYTLTSYIRPDLRAARRNAYYRMFGMDLNHGTEDGRPYPYVKPEASNKEFVNTFEDFLKEVWVGIENAKNTTGTNPTDTGTIVDLASRLQAMLSVRREYGNLSREEYFFVTTMSWFQLALLYDSSIVMDLKANATTPEQRLNKIGARVGMPAHGKSYHFFQLADCVSVILYAIEGYLFNQEANIHLLYAPGPDEPQEYLYAMQTLITHWSAAAGRDMKAKSVITRR